MTELLRVRTAVLDIAVDDLDDRPSALNVKATNLPPGATWDGVARTFTWTPTPAQKGTYTVRLVANDGVASSVAIWRFFQPDDVRTQIDTRSPPPGMFSA